MNPSAAQLLEAVERLDADEVVLLPNNGNVVLTAEQAAGMSERAIIVVPSTSIPMGLAAMVAYDADADGVGNAALMQEAIDGLQTAEVTRAVRDSELDGITVRKGQAMSIVDGRLVAASDDIEVRVRRRARARSPRATPKYVTVLHRAQWVRRHSGAARGGGVAARPRCRGPLPRGRTAAVSDPCERRMTDLLTLENTAFVLDSTCDPPPGFFDRPGLYLVPLKVHFGDEMFRDGVDMTYQEFFAKLEASEVLPTTSQPTVAEFTAAYEEATASYEHVFSLHISGEMSGTVRAAEQAAEAFEGVEVYDTRTVTTTIAILRRTAPCAPRAAAARRTRPTPTSSTSSRTRASSSTPRRSTTCGAAAASAAPPRSWAASSTSSPSS